MKATYQQKGDTLYYTPEEDVDGGEVVDLETRIGITSAPIHAGEQGTIHVVGVFAIDKAEGEDITMGAAVYYNATDGTITATADGNTPAGYAAAPATSTHALVLVKLLG